jgi:heme A synthase
MKHLMHQDRAGLAILGAHVLETTAMDSTSINAQPTSWRLRSAGYWMVAIMTLLMFVNFGRAFIDPVGFAGYVGLPISGQDQAGFVHLYAFRALFLGLFAAFLVWRSETRTLIWFVLIAVVMPFGDAILTAKAGAGLPTVGRHVGIAVFLLATAFALNRMAIRQTGD